MSAARGAVPAFSRRAHRVPATAGVAVAIPSELRAWRARTLGAVVQITGDVVTLHEIGSARRFTSVEAACAAVEGAQ